MVTLSEERLLHNLKACLASSKHQTAKSASLADLVVCFFNPRHMHAIITLDQLLVQSGFVLMVRAPPLEPS